MLVDTKKVFEKLQKIDLVPWEDDERVMLIPYDPVMLALHSPDCEVKIQPPSRIEAAIRYIKEEKPVNDWNMAADLLQWVLTGEKDQNRWTDKGLGFEEEK